MNATATKQGSLLNATEVVSDWLASAHGCDISEDLSLALLQCLDGARSAAHDLPQTDDGYVWRRVPADGPEQTLSELRMILSYTPPADRTRLVQWLHDEQQQYDTEAAT